MQELTKPWDLNENIVTKFARNDRTEQLFAKAQVNPMPEVLLALALDSFKATGEYEIAIEEWEKKPLPDKTFANFRPFILKEYVKRSKPSNATAKSARFEITNAATTNAPHDETLAALRAQQDAETAWAVSEIAKGLKKGNDEQIKC
jgi:hypothetical protein